MRRWPLSASIGHRKLHFIRSPHNGRLLVAPIYLKYIHSLFYLLIFHSFTTTHAHKILADTSLAIVLPFNVVTAVCLCEHRHGCGWFLGGIWSIHQVIRSLRNFHRKVFLGPNCVVVRVFARICYPAIGFRLSALPPFRRNFHSIHSLRLESVHVQLYIVHFLCCLKVSLSHLFSDFAIIMTSWAY